MEKIQAYKTSDGKLFEDSLQADRHELFLGKLQIVEEFLASELNSYQAVAQRAIARSSVVNWEFWKLKNVA
jgi:hypothetical protein